MHPVKPVAASPQQLSLFLAQPEHLAQGTEKTESASETKIHQVIDGRYLKECNLTVHLINTAWSSAEGKNGWSYNFNPPCALIACTWTPLFILFIYLLIVFHNPHTAVRRMDTELSKNKYK